MLSTSFVRGWGIRCVALIGLGLAFACRGDVSPSEVLARTAAASTVPGNPIPSVTFNLVFPAGYGLSKVAVGASSSLQLDQNSKILGSSGSLGIATSTGSSQVSLDSGAQLGTLVNIGALKIDSKATVTQAISGGAVTV